MAAGVEDGKLGLVAAARRPAPTIDVEVRAFFPKDGMVAEDPVTGSLNASLAQWLLGQPAGSPRPTSPARARRSAAPGGVHVSQDADGTIWIGGGTVTCIDGEL